MKTAPRNTRCQALVTRQYSQSGRCEKIQDVRVIRWAPSELKTQVLLLCPAHRSYVEKHGKIQTVGRGQ